MVSFPYITAWDGGDYTVTFLLLCGDKVKYEVDGRPKIPFWAKAVFRENCQVIKELGV